MGRPARINRQQIVEAANEVGLSGLTLRAVADRLGVSIASLYHHVDGKDDLLRLAAEQSVARTPIPRDQGQDWRSWLREWAIYNRSAFLAEPELLNQYMDGAIAPEVVAENTELILRVLQREGFTRGDAAAAYQLVSSCAVGAAVRGIRTQRERLAGRTPVTPADEPFDAQVEMALDGIAARRG